MAPEKPRLVFPRGGQLFKRGRRGRGKAEKSRGERNGTKRGERRNESVAVGSEPRGEGRPEGKTRSFLTGSEEPEGTTGEEEKIGSSLCVRERERDKKEEGEREKKRKKKRRGKKEEKKKRKRRKRKRSTHHHPLGWTRRMRAIPWRSIRLSYPSLFPLDFLPIY